VLDHGVGNHQRHVGGNRRQLEAQVAAIQQQRVILGPLAEMNWSMMPQFAPTNSFSARWQSRASTGPG
jgi:hypothetical protein